MVKQPHGTVTLLFSDIEGSTRLLQELGRERYAETLDLHRRLLREAFERRGGYEVDSEGDAFFVAFQSATDAVAAAFEAQQALAAFEWPDGRPVRVRIGIHTGEPLAVPPKYVGLEVHRAARIMAAGHGGQVLVSETTARLVEVEPLLFDLGLHRLKDFEQPLRLYQLGAGEFPPLKSLNQSNLPIPATPFLGRGGELAELLALLRREDVRLLTLTGPGGAGKTRLALETANSLKDDFDQIAFVDLTTIHDQGLVLPAIAQALGLKEAGAESLEETVTRYLRDRRLLLLLDNFEQVLAAAPLVSHLLTHSTLLNVLTTSRGSLRVAGEHEFAVPPLNDEEASVLFTTRARALDPKFVADDTTTRICHRLDGLPLAIELAAARTRLLSPSELLIRLDKRLELLSSGARDSPHRHQTLRATIGWSHELLEQPERALFARLAVFVGGCSLEALQAVCAEDGSGAGDLLERVSVLVANSLLRAVRPSAASETRLAMFETIREFALERLDATPDGVAVRERHAGFFSDLVRHAENELGGPRATHWLAVLDREYDNILAALAWLESSGHGELDVAAALWRYFYYRGRLGEGTRLLTEALARGADSTTEARLKAIDGLCVFAAAQGNYEPVGALAKEQLALARESNDMVGRGRALTNIGTAAHSRSDLATARQRYTESINVLRTVDAPWPLAVSLMNLGSVATAEGAADEAIDLCQEALELFRTLGDDFFIAMVLENLAWVHFQQRNFEGSQNEFENALTIAIQSDHKETSSYCLEGLAAVAAATGRVADASRLLQEAESIRKMIGAKLQPFEQEVHDATTTIVAAAASNAVSVRP